MDLLRAIWTINRHAKDQDGPRRDALYQLKLHSIKKLYRRGWPDDVNLHDINGTHFYCFELRDYSFHLPKRQWDEQVGLTIEGTGDVQVLERHTSDGLERTKVPAEAVFPALCTIFNKLNLTPNMYVKLDEVLWPDLPDGINKNNDGAPGLSDKLKQEFTSP